METRNSRLTLSETKGLLTQMMDVLSGKEADYWSEVFKKTLRKKNPFGDNLRNTWKTITLGKYKDVNAYREAIKAKKDYSGQAWAEIWEGADEILNSSTFAISTIEQTVDLAYVQLPDIGIKGTVDSFNEIWEAANLRGLEKCPAEVGLALFEQYNDMKEGAFGHGDWLTVAMEPIIGADGIPRIFKMGRHQNCDNLGAYQPTSHCGGNTHPFVFKIRK